MSLWNARQGCADARRTMSQGRRSFLQIGTLGLGGLSLADVLRSEAQAAPQKPTRPTSVIILLDAGRAEPYRYVGYQARRTGRVPR